MSIQLEEFGTILLFQLIVFTTFLMTIILSRLLSPRNPNKNKDDSFECGEAPSGYGRSQFVFRYYPYLLMFMVFDVASMFLFAWAAAFSSLGLELHIFIFAFLLTILPPLGFAVHEAGKSERWS
ncbi:MAG: NADH-quinone oxidoreductase subunit A [Promethearchaeota archaeon]